MVGKVVRGMRRLKEGRADPRRGVMGIGPEGNTGKIRAEDRGASVRWRIFGRRVAYSPEV